MLYGVSSCVLHSVRPGELSEALSGVHVRALWCALCRALWGAFCLALLPGVLLGRGGRKRG